MPDLAKSWEGSPDATEFTFHLHEGVTFHDGTPATSSDVVATYEAILNPDIPSSALSVLNMIETVEAVAAEQTRRGALEHFVGFGAIVFRRVHLYGCV